MKTKASTQPVLHTKNAMTKIENDKVYVLFFKDTYVDVTGDEEPPEVMGVFTSVEEIEKYMSGDSWLQQYIREDNKWIRKSMMDYPHDVYYYYEEFELNKAE